MALRTRLLSEMALKLMKLAKKFRLAVRINLFYLPVVFCTELVIDSISSQIMLMQFVWTLDQV